MRKCLVLAGLSVLAATASATEVYRWVDEDGVVHYSDSPHPGAQKVEIAEPTTVPAYRRPDAAQRTAPTDGDSQAAAPGYQSLSIVQPSADETLWNIEGRLTVQLALQPALRPGDRVRLYFDGEPREVSGLQVQLDEVYRGAHSLQAEVVNQAGELMIRSEPIRFYVQQTSILNKR